MQFAEVAVVEALGDQEHCVGARGPGLEELVRIQNEVFAEDGNLDCGANLPQVVETPLKVLLVGQNAKATGPGSLVDAGDLDRIKVGPNDPLAGAGFLDFGDEADGDFASAFRW